MLRCFEADHDAQQESYRHLERERDLLRDIVVGTIHRLDA